MRLWPSSASKAKPRRAAKRRSEIRFLELIVCGREIVWVKPTRRPTWK
jgi:hypothetical protein